MRETRNQLPASIVASACPLCGNSQARSIEHLTGAQLRSLWRALGWEFSPAAWGPIAAESVVTLHQCAACGFQFFAPTLAGNETFYRELERADYFVENRPEFQRTLRLARSRGLTRILDVGCGSGIFLDLARAAGCETWGLELNGAAAEKARTKGHKVTNTLLDEARPEQFDDRLDLVTVFQVLEHVAEPAQLLRKAATLLKPGGCVAIAVPAANGVLRLAPSDPHQWPPHHLSRWRLQDFQQLAHASGLTLIESGGDQLLGSEILYFSNLEQRLAPILGKQQKHGNALIRMFSLLYRKTGMKWIFPRRGMSIYAYFQRSR